MNIEPGDYVVDPLDGEIRRVSFVVEDTIWLADGGMMGVDENPTVLLPSEVEDIASGFAGKPIC